MSNPFWNELGEIMVGFVVVVVDETWFSRLLQKLEEMDIKITSYDFVHFLVIMMILK